MEKILLFFTAASGQTFLETLFYLLLLVLTEYLKVFFKSNLTLFQVLLMTL